MTPKQIHNRNVAARLMENFKKRGILSAYCETKEDALSAIAKKALDRQIGARGLRAIMERVMTKIMFQIPSDLTIKKVIITPECILGGEPTILRDANHPRQALI